MKIKANKAFSSITLSMYEGEVRDVADKSLVSDLVTSGLAVEIKTASLDKKAVKKNEGK